MSQKTMKLSRRAARKEALNIQKDALAQWSKFIANHTTWSRFKFCVKLFFKRKGKVSE